MVYDFLEAYCHLWVTAANDCFELLVAGCRGAFYQILNMLK